MKLKKILLLERSQTIVKDEGTELRRSGTGMEHSWKWIGR